MDRTVPNLPSRDLDVTCRFYEAWGFRETYRDDGWMILRRGPLMLEFFLHPDVDPLSSGFQCTFRVRDLDELWQALNPEAAPLTTTGYPRRHAPSVESSGLRIGYVVDPDGTQLTLIEDPAV